MLGIADTIIGVFGETLDKFLPDQNKKLEALAEVRAKILENEAKILAIAGDIVGKETVSERWYQNAWRPALMWIIIIIIFNNFLLAPYVGMIFGYDLTLNVDVNSLPEELWRAIDIGLGGYVIGRSAEKIVKDLKKKK
jgi:hypothetical protein